LFEQYRPNFVVVARSYVRDQMVAEDIVNDCFITFWENREKIDLAQNIPGYILTSIKNRCLNHLRDQSTRLKAQQDIHSTTTRIMALRIATLETNDPDHVFAEEVAFIVENEIKKMPTGMQNVFLANRFEDMTYKQVAEKFGLSVNQVDFEIRKAVKLLQAALKDYLAALLVVHNMLNH
jgi:RNA polymerase sigma-70 factor (ECF subfamily)